MDRTDLLTVRQLEQILRVDRITIYRMLGDGRLPGFKVGGQWRFSRPAIQSWLQRQQSGYETDVKPWVGNDLSPSAEALPLSCIEAIQEIVGEALGVGAVTTRLDGTPMTPVANCSAFCRLILGSAEGKRRCEGSWRSGAARPEGSPRTGICHAGLRYARGRIEVRGVAVAVVHAGQFLEQVPTGPDWSARIGLLAATFGLDGAELGQALGQVPVLDPEAQQKLSRLMRKMMLTFSEIGEERLYLVGRLQRIAEITQL